MKRFLCFMCAFCVLFVASNAFAFPKPPMSVKWEYIDIDRTNGIVALRCVVGTIDYSGNAEIELSTSPGIELSEGNGEREIVITAGEPYSFDITFRIISRGDQFVRAVARSMDAVERAPKGIAGIRTVTVNLDEDRIIRDGVSDYYEAYEPIDFDNRVGKKENEEQKLTPGDIEKLERTRTEKGTARKYLSEEGEKRLEMIDSMKRSPSERVPMETAEIESPRPDLKGAAEGKNLSPYTPVGWDYPIVPSSLTGTNTVGPNLTGGEYTYIDLAIDNNGTENITEEFYIDLYLDDVFIGYYTCNGLTAGYYAYDEDGIYIIDEGYHTLKMVIDPYDVVWETNENDNEYERQFYWNPPPKPDLTCYKPPGWQLSIIASSEPGTHTAGPDLQSGYKTYIDWAIRNEGSSNITGTFDVKLTLDASVIETWTVNGLDILEAHSVEDFEYFVPDGVHTLDLDIDCYNDIDEEDEFNNGCPEDFYWTRTPQLTVDGYFDFDNKIEVFNVPIKNAKVVLWDHDSDGNDDSLTCAYTDGNGYYSLGPVNNIDEDEGDSYQDFYVRVYADGNAAKVIDSSEETWRFSTDIWYEASSEYYFEGYWSAPTEDDDAAFNIYNVVLTGYGWTKARLPLDTPPQATVTWYPGNPTDTGYSEGANQINILGQSGEYGLGPDQWDNGVILHEYGHLIGDWQKIMKPEGGGSHTWHSEIDEFMAWAEGWAHYFSMGTRNNPIIVRTGTEIIHTVNGEDGTEVLDFIDPEEEDLYFYANDLGEDCEASVVGILWDIYDAAQDDQNQDGVGDELNDSHDGIWIIIDMYESGLPSHGIYSILEFWDAWVAYQYSPVDQLWATYFEHGIDKDDGPPSVTVLEPNGGELLYAGGQFLIEWNASDAMSGVDRIDILLSTNGGTDYPYVEFEGAGNDGEELWTVAGTVSQDCKIKAIAYDRAGHSSEDVSDNVFEIKKVIVVDVPDGGEMAAIGCDLTIEWSVLDTSVTIDQFDISCSRNGGSTYDPITSCAGTVREILWEDISGPPSDECLVKVVAHVAGGIEYTDISDACFAIFEPVTEWTPPCDGVPICTAPHYQLMPQVIRDGFGGTIVSWVDYRVDGYWEDLYTQKIDAAGNVLWTADGLAVCTANYVQDDVRCVSDGSGGAIYTWDDSRTNESIDIYAQRVDANGSLLWTTNGVPVASVSLMPYMCPKITTDMAGGAIIAWFDGRTGDYSVFAQRINADGEPLWTAEGVDVRYNTVSGMYSINIVSDVAGGAFIVWCDNTGADQNIYLHRINSEGEKYWPYQNPGIDVCEAADDQWLPLIIADGSGGVIVVWWDERNCPGCYYTDIYAQKIDADGVAQWTTDGVVIGRSDCDNTWDVTPQIITDGSGGAIIAWYDGQGGDDDIYVQRVDADGVIQWTEGGIAVCAAPGNQNQPWLAPDGPGGAIVSWSDTRGGGDVYAQRIDASGTALWREDGECVSTGSTCQHEPVVVEGGVLIYSDNRNGQWDLFAQKIEATAPAPTPDCVITYYYYDEDLDTTYLPSEDILFCCPQGDARSLVVTLDFDDEDMTRDIGAGEISLDIIETPARFFSEGLITADSAATSGNGYVTTITHPYIGGCSECDGCVMPDIPVRLNGTVIGAVDADTLVVRSPDYNRDGYVSLSDLSFFGETYNKCEGYDGYNSCFDFTNDGCVSLSDFSFIGEHYNHIYPGFFPYMTLAGSSAKSDVGVKLSVEQVMGTGHQSTLRVTVCLENADRITAASLALDAGNSPVEFLGWTPNAGLNGTALAVPVNGRERELIVLGSFGMETAGESEIELGTLEFAIPAGTAVDVTDGLFGLAFGEVMDASRNITYMLGVECEEQTPVYRNELANNYPNPFNPTTTIEYSIADDSPVSLSIYNVNGQLVRTLVNEFKVKNRYRTVWDGKDNRGNPVSSGVYFYRIVTDGFRQSKKLIILR